MQDLCRCTWDLYFFIFFLNFWILFIFLYSRFLLVIYFIHIGIYMSIPISQFIPPPPPPPPPLSPLGVHTFVLYIWVGSLVAACGIWPGIEPGLPALGAWSLNHWTTREVPHFIFVYLFKIFIYLFYFWLHWVLVEAHGFFVVACGIFCCSVQASLVVTHMLSSCNTRV